MSDWRDHAACRGLTHLFFAPKDEPEARRRAIAICRSCPVILDCAEAARDEVFGVWAGTSERQRKKVKRRATTPGMCSRCGRASIGTTAYCEDCRRARRNEATRRWRQKVTGRSSLPGGSVADEEMDIERDERTG